MSDQAIPITRTRDASALILDREGIICARFDYLACSETEDARMLAAWAYGWLTGQGREPDDHAWLATRARAIQGVWQAGTADTPVLDNRYVLRVV